MLGKGRIIALSGLARSGKNACATIIRELIPNSEEIAFADPIKTIGRKLFDFSDEQAYGKLKEAPDQRYPRPCEACFGSGHRLGETDVLPTEPCQACDGSGKVFLTPRWAYQFIGTELGRALYPDVWVDYTLRFSQDLLAGAIVKVGPDNFKNRVAAEMAGRFLAPTPKVVIITDLRFINEIYKVKAADGLVGRVDRPGNVSKLSAQAKQHRSETEQQTLEFLSMVDFTIPNTGTFEDLKIAVKQALITNNLL